MFSRNFECLFFLVFLFLSSKGVLLFLRNNKAGARYYGVSTEIDPSSFLSLLFLSKTNIYMNAVVFPFSAVINFSFGIFCFSFYICRCLGVTLTLHALPWLTLYSSDITCEREEIKNY
jgi:hypothetical protein